LKKYTKPNIKTTLDFIKDIGQAANKVSKALLKKLEERNSNKFNYLQKFINVNKDQ